MKKNTFRWLNVSQFGGAFIDNAFKMTAVLLLVSILGEGSLAKVLAACSAIFVTPFILFSNAAGTLADRVSKRSIVIGSKWLEVALLILAVPAMLSGMAWPLYALLFLLCTQSALFGPAKRGIVPELVEHEHLARANGFLTAATYGAIILGTALPALLTGFMGLHVFYTLACCLVLAAVGTYAAYRIEHVPAAGSHKKSSVWIVPDVIRAVKHLKGDSWARQAVTALVFFSGVTALLQQVLVLFGTEVLDLPVDKSPMLFPLAAIGIGLGALLSGHFSKRNVEAGLIPVGALGTMISILGLCVSSSIYWIGFWIINVGLGCGLFLVPLNAFLQHRIPVERRGELFGAVSFLSFSAMVVASVLFYLLSSVLGISARGCVFSAVVLVSIPSVLTVMRLPSHFVRFWVTRLVKRIYRIRFKGVENLPTEGGALLICNHTAFADALILQAATERPVRFLMSRDTFKNWKWLKPIFKVADCIPIHTSDGPRALVKSLQEAREAMENGAIVGIFPEGALTTNGNLMKFNKGFEKIAKNSNCPIIPAYIGNLWGSIFSHFGGKPGFRRPKKLRFPVNVRFGEALPSDTTADEARRVIAELGAEYAIEKSKRPSNTLNHAYLKQARRHWLSPIASDTLGRKATYGRLTMGAIALNKRLGPQLENEDRVGLFLPTSLGTAMANLSVTLSGKCAVNLNWTASADAMHSAVAQSGIKYVITSRKFLEKTAQPDIPVTWLYLEDLLKDLSATEKMRALFAGMFASARKLAGGIEQHPDDTAAIIFSSGSTGIPKGVMLSHANLLSNVDSVSAVQRFEDNDIMCAILPLFHAFGYLALFWWPLLKGTKVVYHPNPLQTGRVIRLVREKKLTALLATPTFLQAYMRKASVEDFASLRIVITGGEKLRPHIAESFEEKFGLHPLEGYGCTELSPVGMLSLEKSFRSGSTGQPLPGMAVRIVHPETGDMLPAGEEGLMLVKGPNVMKGYLNNPEKTAEVLKDGWYNTGDMACMDAKGFVYLSGRLSRFSKIGGEMVPHGAVEEALQEAVGSNEPCIAVVGIADATKGEQLAVCYTAEAGDPKTLIEKLRGLGLPNLWIPRLNNFIRIPELPTLGTGKLDLGALRAFTQLPERGIA